MTKIVISLTSPTSIFFRYSYDSSGCCVIDDPVDFVVVIQLVAVTS